MTHAEQLNTGMKPFYQHELKSFRNKNINCLCPSSLSLTKSYIHSVLARHHFDFTKPSHTYVTALIFLFHVDDVDASLKVAVVTHTRGQRLSIAGLQSQEGDPGVGHKTGDGAVLTCTHQDDVHHGALEGILRVCGKREGDVDVIRWTICNHMPHHHHHLKHPPFTYT